MAKRRNFKPPTKRQWAAICRGAASVGMKPWAYATCDALPGEEPAPSTAPSSPPPPPSDSSPAPPASSGSEDTAPPPADTQPSSQD